MANSRVLRNALQLLGSRKINYNVLSQLPMRCTSSDASNFGVDWQQTPIGVPQYQSLPVIISRPLSDLNNVNTDVIPIREVWMENMSSLDAIKLAIIQLHPRIFGSFPRVDHIQSNYVWQTLYKKVDFLCLKTRHELRGDQRKPWPQKGTGRARQGSYRAPQWIGGGWVHGPRGPKTYFYMLPFTTRVSGLISMLTVKLAQDDLKLVDTLETLPSDDPKYIEELCDRRGWGPSVLFIDKSDLFPKNISIATDTINHINLMPVYGLNVFSMLKHETLVLTLAAVEEIEQKLLFQLKRTDLKTVIYRYKPPGISHM